jgi:phosphatidylinositol alpha-1,6-mannosyltransferase
MVSRVNEPYKGHDELIDCWPRVAAAIPGARLTFAGRGGRLEAVRARAEASPVAAAIEVLGFVPDDQLDDLYASADVFAMPSRGEGFGFVYTEAMRHGLPVIASQHDAGREVNVDGETGYNVNMDRPEELPDRLIRLLSDPAHAASLGAASRRRWETHFRASAFESRLDRHLSDFWTGAWGRSAR